MTLTQISTSGIKDSNVTTADIADQAVTLDKLPHGTSSNNGKFLRANNGADPTFETINTNLVADTSPQLGGNLASNGNDINFADGDKVIFGTDSDLQIYHESNNSWIKELGSGSMNINTNRLNVANAADNEVMINAQQDGAVDLYYDGSKKFETTTNGVHVTGDLRLNDNEQIYLGNSTDLQFFHDPSVGNVINNAFCHLIIRDTSGTTGAIFKNSGSVELNHNGSKKFETTSTGVKIGDRVEFNGNTIFDNSANGNNIGLAFDSAGAITPTDGAANRVNNSKDLGTASYQWNDLHLGGSANVGNYIRTNYDGGGHMYFRNNSGSSLNFSSHFQTYRDTNEGGTAQTHIHYYHGGYCELLHQGSSAIRTRSGGGVDFNNGGTRIGIFDPEGLKFGTDTSSANALDDYEEGGFTPTYDGTWTNISNSHLRHAKYTKIGNTVHVWMEYFMTNNNGAFANSSNIRNFPYSGPSSLYVPVVLGIMYGPSGYSMDQTSAGRAYFDAGDDRLYFRMGSFSGIRHIWIQFTYPTA